MFSAVCVALSACGHALASGVSVPLWSLLAGWAGVVCVVGPLAGRERSLPGIVLTLLVGEFGLHVLFCSGQTSVAPAPTDRSASVVAMAERLLCNPQAAHLTPREAVRILRLSGMDPSGALSTVHSPPSMPGMPNMPGMAEMVGHGGVTMMLGSMFTPSMIAVHVIAAVVTGWVLRRCEIALWQAVRLPAVAAEHLARLDQVWRLSGLLDAVRGQVLMTGLLDRLLAVLAAHRRREDAAGVRSLRFIVLRTCAARRGPPAAALAA